MAKLHANYSQQARHGGEAHDLAQQWQPELYHVPHILTGLVRKSERDQGDDECTQEGNY